jgi:putative spermidine/putrescine transport system permease protein
LTFAHYHHFFTTPVYSRVLLTTLRISLWTTAAAALLAYPVALVMVRSPPILRQAITMIVIAPLIVSVVVRTYGWQLILGNGPTGILNWLLLRTGLAKKPVALLYSDAAMVIGSLHVFFPMMVLPVASTLARIDPRLEDAARTLGATAWRTFRRITFPLSLPGLAVGCALVFSLTAGSLVTPAILGGTGAQMLGMLVDQQILVVYDWPFGATVASVLVAVVLAVNIVSMRVSIAGGRCRRDERGVAQPASLAVAAGHRPGHGVHVAENIAFGLETRGVKGAAAAARVQGALQLVQLSGYGARLPSQLSGGQQQRVAGPGTGRRTDAAVARRTARSARQESAPEHANGTARSSAATRRHDGHRHPRPGRGADDGGPDRHYARRLGRADRHPLLTVP